MGRIKKDNRGYSLVELIIVVAIIAAVATTAVLSVGMVFSANAKTCANDIMSAISECKITTMSYGQGNVRLLIYRGSNGNIYSELQTRSKADASWEDYGNGPENIGARKCSVTDGAGNELPQKAGDALPTQDSEAWAIYYDRSSGSFRSETTVSELHIEGGSKHYRIGLQTLTGKAILELL